jgi:superoxide reductase
MDKQINRRAFLEASAMGTVIAATGGLFKLSGGDAPAKSGPAIFVCSVCGHVEFGVAPEYCPVCHAAKDQFTRNDSVFKDAIAKSAELPVKHIPEITVTKISKLITETPTMDVTVRIGKTLHPMEQAHHIQWIDCYIDDRYISRILLTPGSRPAAGYYPGISGSKVRIVERCNLHGHWQAEMALM